MEKRTVLAIVLSTLVFLGFQLLNSYLNPISEDDVVIEQPTIVQEVTEEKIIQKNDNIISKVKDDRIYIEEKINLKTELFDVTFNTKGASITSLKLNSHTENVGNDEKVDMVLQEIENNSLFGLTLSDNVFNEVFSFNKIDNLTYEFSKNFILKDNNGNNSGPLLLVKTYKFIEDEYMFELRISIKNDENTLIPMNSDGSLYNLNVTKQIGPKFKKLDNREDYRKVSIFTEGKRDELKVKKYKVQYNETYDWVALEGKFFTLVVIPENINPSLNYNNELVNGISKSDFVLNRSNLNTSFIEDTYKIYAGPKDKSILDIYNNSDSNKWNISELNINKIIHFWFLGMFFMWVLIAINSVVNNYGITIIILTIIIKIILYPFTKKSFESMGKMQTIQPEIKKIQEKYKNDSAKLNTATSELYKKEGVNPLGGCLPMLLQMPIFITFYSLFNEFIGLRGSTFIPGWIIDLSKPEFVVQFDFNIPIVGWDALRLLPIIYVATQLISMKFTQNQQSGAASGSSSSQQKMLTLGMPIMFFFIMYNQSSGLLLYWITQNLITSAQQIKSKKKSDKEHDVLLEERTQKKKKKKNKGRK